ncbi:hypothetical protein AF335_13370 [Streptomyces eurocidicus]|uniref:Uncharacterized protein n=1 Tax=Streptomyces eurocidicus TaxID=66423 RepID=A0A2N8NYE4_STREU|nr:hypothetical protein [Streptomyces eurocidicus]MBB5119931.1 hypothetical protein [Streptomyces eurocidicus]MBF6050947.1 hypothetical protein [Streptomyces eurocidicus]PNE33791.1 hypothetical protein AF335_13370 [Streptomyces eurocidicus]
MSKENPPALPTPSPRPGPAGRAGPLGPVPPAGPVSYAVDTRTDRLGQVMDRHAGRLQLRPPQGGVEWDCPPEYARPASEAETLRARVARLNAESRWGL